MTDIIESTATDVTAAITDTVTIPSESPLRSNIRKGKKAPAKPKAKSAMQTVADALGGKPKSATRRTVRQVKTSAKEVTHVTSTDPVVQEANEALKDAAAQALLASTRDPEPGETQRAVADARALHTRMKADFLYGLQDIAGQVLRAKDAAKREGIKFESLFANPNDPACFPFSQNWANTIVRVYESRLLDSDLAPRLPSDLTTLATLASTTPTKREAVLRRYEEIRTGDFSLLDGEIVLAKVTTQKAMKKAKAEITGEGEEGATPSKKAPKEFNAARMARSLFNELGHDALADLAEAIDAILEANEGGEEE